MFKSNLFKKIKVLMVFSSVESVYNNAYHYCFVPLYHLYGGTDGNVSTKSLISNSDYYSGPGSSTGAGIGSGLGVGSA